MAVVDRYDSSKITVPLVSLLENYRLLLTSKYHHEENKHDLEEWKAATSIN